MTKSKRDRLCIWTVGVRSKKSQYWVPTSLRWFHTRKECQDYIDNFRKEMNYGDTQHTPMRYYPA